MNGADGTATALEISCEEKARLIRLYSKAVSDYNRAVQVLYLRSDVVKKNDYLKYRGLSEMARKKAELVRKALNRHTADHRC